jgi:circadian clock protein KaiC
MKKESILVKKATSKKTVFKPQAIYKTLPKVLTGIPGFDEITFGGLPKGRSTLIYGNAGSGKTLFAMQFLIQGIVQYNEPGVFMSFEETENDLIANFSSLGIDLTKLGKEKKLLLDHVHFEKSEIGETGEYNLDGLFVRLNYAINSIGAKRVVLDTIESLFSGLTNIVILRAELRRLFAWLKEKGVTAIITGEKGNGLMSRQGIEEYVSDCVVLLDNRVTEQSSTRRLRITKYRGSLHGTNEYPFLIEANGISIIPITSVGLSYSVSSERISSGIARLDTMLGGKGYFKGSSIMVSGTAGCGKTSLAAYLVISACSRGEKVLYFTLEESPYQIIRNMISIGIELEKWEKKGLLSFHSNRPTFYGSEAYLMSMHKKITEFDPKVVIIDPISSFMVENNSLEAKSIILRLIDYLKLRGITTFMTNLTAGGKELEHTEINITSQIDTWILLRDIEYNGERNRGVYILKSRGMEHSNQIREFKLTDKGADILDVYVGAEGVLTGSARLSQERKEKEVQLLLEADINTKQQKMERRRKALNLQIEAMKAEFEAEELEYLKEVSTSEDVHKRYMENMAEQGISRQEDIVKKIRNKKKLVK